MFILDNYMYVIKNIQIYESIYHYRGKNRNKIENSDSFVIRRDRDYNVVIPCLDRDRDLEHLCVSSFF